MKKTDTSCDFPRESNTRTDVEKLLLAKAVWNDVGSKPPAMTAASDWRLPLRVAADVAFACAERPATEMSCTPPAVVPSALSAVPWSGLPIRLVTAPSGWSEKLPARV